MRTCASKRWFTKHLVPLGLVAMVAGAVAWSRVGTGNVLVVGVARAADEAPLVEGDDLARTWPTRLGTKVRLRSRVERATDLLHVVVRAGKEPFSVMLSPGAAWSGEAVRTFTVMGVTTVRLPGGPLQVAELLLDEPSK